MTPTQQMNTQKAALGMAGIICSSFPRAARTGTQRKEPGSLHRSTILNSKDVKKDILILHFTRIFFSQDRGGFPGLHQKISALFVTQPFSLATTTHL